MIEALAEQLKIVIERALFLCPGSVDDRDAEALSAPWHLMHLLLRAAKK